MDKNIKIQLNSKKHVNSVNIDTFTKIQLNNNLNNIYNKDLRKVISESDVFENERQGSNKYRIYGEINFLSLLHGLKLDYLGLSDYFIDQPINHNNIDSVKNIMNSFDVYLLKPSAENYLMASSILNGRIRKFDVIATPSDIDIFPVAFAKNIYNNTNYCYVVSLSQDIENVFDNYNVPITEFFLYFQYKPTTSTANAALTENMFRKTQSGEVSYTPVSYSKGDVITQGDIVVFDRNNYNITTEFDLTYVIETRYMSMSTPLTLRWEYNPLQPIRLRYFENVVNKINKNTKSQEQLDSVPSYVVENSDDYYIWRNIQPHGISDPVSGVGTDYPFANNTHYVFDNIILDVVPDLTHANTSNVFENIVFGDKQLNYVPSGDINNINNIC